MGLLGISLRWALEGKQTNRSAEGGPLLSLPSMVCLFVFSFFFFSLLCVCVCVFGLDLVLAVVEMYV